MSLFHKIKTYLYARNESTENPENSEASHSITHHLTLAECLEVAGGPQVRNDTEM